MDEFFEPPSPSKWTVESPPPREWDGPPRDAVPAIVPVEQVIAQNDDVGVFLTCLLVYPAGFQFEVFVVSKDELAKLNPFNFGQYEAEHIDGIPPTKLRLGFLFADGSKATNTGDEFDWDEEDDSRPKTPVLSRSRGAGGEGKWSQTFWVWPIPPPGPLQFVCEWPGAGIPLTYVDLDSTAIIDAASRAKTIFPSS